MFYFVLHMLISVKANDFSILFVFPGSIYSLWTITWFVALMKSIIPAKKILKPLNLLLLAILLIPPNILFTQFTKSSTRMCLSFTLSLSLSGVYLTNICIGYHHYLHCYHMRPGGTVHPSSYSVQISHPQLNLKCGTHKFQQQQQMQRTLPTSVTHQNPNRTAFVCLTCFVVCLCRSCRLCVIHVFGANVTICVDTCAPLAINFELAHFRDSNNNNNSDNNGNKCR